MSVKANASSMNAKADSKSAVLQQLQQRIRRIESAERAGAEQTVSSGCVAIDRLLPASGYRRGSLVQWITGGGNGADYLSLLTAAVACRAGGSLVVVDSANQFYPPAAAALGLPLERTIILRSSNNRSHSSDRKPKHSDAEEPPEHFLWSIDQSLRCPAVAAVWGPIETIDARWFRRFQLSAEASGCVGIFVQPPSAAAAPTWADVQWCASSLSPAERSTLELGPNEQPLHLTLARCRGTFAGQAICLGINTVTGDVHAARPCHESAVSSPRESVQWSTIGPAQEPIAANRLPVVPQLGHPASNRQPA